MAGVTRVRLETPLPVLSETNRLPHHPIQYSVVDSKKGITEPAAEAFRSAAIRLVERLDAEAKSQERRGKTGGVEWKKLRGIIEDAEMEKTPFVAGMTRYFHRTYVFLMAILRYSYGSNLDYTMERSPSDALNSLTGGPPSIGYIHLFKASCDSRSLS